MKISKTRTHRYGPERTPPRQARRGQAKQSRHRGHGAWRGAERDVVPADGHDQHVPRRYVVPEERVLRSQSERALVERRGLHGRVDGQVLPRPTVASSLPPIDVVVAAPAAADGIHTLAILVVVSNGRQIIQPVDDVGHAPGGAQHLGVNSHGRRCVVDPVPGVNNIRRMNILRASERDERRHGRNIVLVIKGRIPRGPK